MYTIEEYYSSGKHWAVYKPDGEMLCICLYKKGAICLVNHLNEITSRIFIGGKVWNVAYKPQTKKGELK